MKYGMMYTRTRRCPNCKDWVMVDHLEASFEWNGDDSEAPGEAVNQIRLKRTPADFTLGNQFHLSRVFRIDVERKITELQFQPFRYYL